MSVASDALTHLVSLLEGRVDPEPPRGIDADKFVFTELDQELTFAAASDSPYPFGLLSPEKNQPLDTPSNVSGTYVFRGQQIPLWVAYTYDEHNHLERRQEMLDDEKTIHRCLSDPLSWLDVEGIGIVDVDDVEFQDDEEARVMFMVITVRFAIREYYGDE